MGGACTEIRGPIQVQDTDIFHEHGADFRVEFL
jgi:hypothetical protein